MNLKRKKGRKEETNKQKIGVDRDFKLILITEKAAVHEHVRSCYILNGTNSSGCRAPFPSWNNKQTSSGLAHHHYPEYPVFLLNNALLVTFFFLLHVFSL